MVKKVRKIIALNEDGHRIGSTHHNATIPDDVVDEIRDLHEDEGWPYSKLAEHFNLGKSTIQKICNYSRRAQTPMNWKTIEEYEDTDKEKSE